MDFFVFVGTVLGVIAVLIVVAVAAWWALSSIDFSK